MARMTPSFGHTRGLTKARGCWPWPVPTGVRGSGRHGCPRERLPWGEHERGDEAADDLPSCQGSYPNTSKYRRQRV